MRAIRSGNAGPPRAGPRATVDTRRRAAIKLAPTGVAKGSGAGDDVMTSGYSGTPLLRKLGIRDGARLAIVSPPAGFEGVLGALPPGVHVRHQARGRLDVILFFVTRRAELARRFPVFVRALVPNGGLWVAWPKTTSGVATDLAFEVVQTVGLDEGLVDNKVCAIDDTWSGLRFVHRLVDRPS
jgi:hypothetical protein